MQGTNGRTVPLKTMLRDALDSQEASNVRRFLVSAMAPTGTLSGAEPDDDDDDDDDEGEEGEVDLAGLQKQVRALTKENKTLRRENAQRRRRAKELEEKDMDENEKTSKRIQELEQENASLSKQNKSLMVEREVTNAATKLGFKDPADAYAFISTEDVFDDEGNVDAKGLNRALKGLKDSKPYLFNETGSGGGSEGDGEGGDASGDGSGGEGGSGASNANAQNNGSGSGGGGGDTGNGKNPPVDKTKQDTIVADEQKKLAAQGFVPMPRI